MAKQFREYLLANLLHTVFICLCDAGTKKLLVSFNYHLLINNIQYIIVYRYPDKIWLKINHCLLKYCTLHNTHFALQYWQPYFSRGCYYQEYWFIFQICLHLNMLILWLKIYMQLLMTYTSWRFWLLSEWKISFEIGSLRCVEYIEKKPNFPILTSLKSQIFFINPSTMVANIQPSSKKVFS